MRRVLIGVLIVAILFCAFQIAVITVSGGLPQVGSLEEVLYGPAPVADGTANLVGALRKSMATTGYSDLKEFQRVDVVVAPYDHS